MWFSFHGIQNKGVNQVWVGDNNQGQQVCREVSGVENNFPLILFNFSGQTIVNILTEKSTFTSTYYVKTVLCKAMLSVRSAQPLVPEESYLFMIALVPTEPRSLYPTKMS